jgi:hypothetical protein
MPAHKIGTFLSAADELKSLSGKMRRLEELQNAFCAVAPADLARGTQVGSCRAGMLYVLADTPAVAAKLRQMAPRLLVEIQKVEAEVTGIHIAVQVNAPAGRRRKSGQKPSLSVDTIEVFQKLADRVPESPLKGALTRLVRRHKHR